MKKVFFIAVAIISVFFISCKDDFDVNKNQKPRPKTTQGSL